MNWYWSSYSFYLKSSSFYIGFLAPTFYSMFYILELRSPICLFMLFWIFSSSWYVFKLVWLFYCKYKSLDTIDWLYFYWLNEFDFLKLNTFDKSLFKSDLYIVFAFWEDSFLLSSNSLFCFFILCCCKYFYFKRSIPFYFACSKSKLTLYYIWLLILF